MKKLLMLSSTVLVLVACSNDHTESIKNNEDIAQQENNLTDTDPLSEQSDEEHYPVTVTNYDYDGNIIEQKFEKEPEKVLAVYQNSIETMLALGLEDRIVAASGLDHEVKPELKDSFDKLNYLDVFAPDKETVLELQPDMILSWHSFFSEKNMGDVDFWHDRNVKTYMSVNSGATENRTLENEYEDIINLGKIFNVEDRAADIVNEVKIEVSKVQDFTNNLEDTPSVMILEKFDDHITVYGNTSLGGDMVKSLNANLLDTSDGTVGHEDLLNLNPDIIFTVYMDEDGLDKSKEATEYFTKDSSLKNLTAVKEGRVYPIALGEMYSSGIRTIDGINTFAKGIYSELYDKK